MGRKYGGEGQIGSDSSKVISGQGTEVQVRHGRHTTVGADDTVDTGLSTVDAVVVSLESDPVIGCDRATGVVGDQAGSPAPGSIQVKTWKPTGTGDATPVAATTFSKVVNWTAYGS